MPSNLKRYQDSGQTHFITFGCWHGRHNLADPAAKQAFLAALERIRLSFRLRVYGYVVMPNHVHFFVSEPEAGVLADAIKSLKQGVARRFIGNAPHFWQKRYYDFNVHNHARFVEKLRYIHRNPVRKALCARPEDWPWSSFNHYATGCEAEVEIESEWTARRREQAAPPLKQKRLSGPPDEIEKRVRVAHTRRFCLVWGTSEHDTPVIFPLEKYVRSPTSFRIRRAMRFALCFSHRSRVVCRIASGLACTQKRANTRCAEKTMKGERYAKRILRG